MKTKNVEMLNTRTDRRVEDLLMRTQMTLRQQTPRTVRLARALACLVCVYNGENANCVRARSIERARSRSSDNTPITAPDGGAVIGAPVGWWLSDGVANRMPAAAA